MTSRHAGAVWAVLAEFPGLMIVLAALKVPPKFVKKLPGELPPRFPILNAPATLNELPG
jgi:hypothetical protein